MKIEMKVYRTAHIRLICHHNLESNYRLNHDNMDTSLSLLRCYGLTQSHVQSHEPKTRKIMNLKTMNQSISTCRNRVKIEI